MFGGGLYRDPLLVVECCRVLFCFFKHNTAYELRISDWSSDVCSSDLPAQTYVVRPGDTLRRISDRLGASSEAIARANNIPPPFIIRVGERLSIPGGRYHRAKSGETGIAIAPASGVSWSKVVDGNDLDEPYVLRVGQTLLLHNPPPVAAI